MEGNKVSFSFSNVKKKPNLLISKQSATEKSNVELIKCVEGKEIKLIVEKKEEAPLVIPLQENVHTSAALASLITRRKVLLGEDEPPPAEKPAPTTESQTTIDDGDVPKDLEKRAEREILSELSKNQEVADDGNFVVPVVKPEDLPLDGAKESTLDDYESIPIAKFGMAMLRGMGWVEPPQKETSIKDSITLPRPKGMGLGADKALKPKPLLIPPESNEVLEIKRQAFVRILGGKHKDLYGQIQGFDDHAGRVVVKMAIGGVIEVFNEFMCQPVSKKEYAEYGKCLNTAKYEEYKRRENEYGQIVPEEDMQIKKENIKKEYDRREYKIKEEKYDDDYDRKDRKKNYYVEQKHKIEKRDDSNDDYKTRNNKSSENRSNRQRTDDYERSKSSSKYHKNEESEDEDRGSKHRHSTSKNRKGRDLDDESYDNRKTSSRRRKASDTEEDDRKYERSKSSSKYHKNVESEDEDRGNKHRHSTAKRRKEKDSEDESYNKKISSKRRNESGSEDDSRKPNSSKHRKEVDSEEEDRKYRHRSRSRDYTDSRAQSSSKHHRKSIPDKKYSDSSDSSDSESDSSIDRRSKKKAKKSKSKRKSKKSKKKSRK